MQGGCERVGSLAFDKAVSTTSVIVENTILALVFGAMAISRQRRIRLRYCDVAGFTELS